MKIVINYPGIIILVVFLIIFSGCKEKIAMHEITTVKLITTVISNIKDTSASSGGNITDDGGLVITTRGVCWSSENLLPTLSDNKTISGTGSGSFVSLVTGLTANTYYYIRAYATNMAGTTYGSTLMFSTNISGTGIITTAVTNITSNSATSGGTISGDGSGITSRGVCWSMNNPAPTIADNITTDGTGAGYFISNMTGLVRDATYYIRAYAATADGKTYGNVLIFTTTTIPVVSTVSYSNILLNTVDFTGDVKNEGGLPVKKRGFCFSRTSQDPTIDDDTIVCGSGAGSFSGRVRGLKGQSGYYIRAYATNNNGTGYGSAIAVTTLDTMMSDIDNNHYRLVQIGTQVWMAENLKVTHYRDGEVIPDVRNNTEWKNLTTGALCWYNNDSESYGMLYGALYNWYSVSDSRMLSPSGWHIPSNNEWETLITYLGGDSIAGGKLKETGSINWGWPNTGADNSSGFTALPGGSHLFDGTFSQNRYNGAWWTSTEVPPGEADNQSLSAFHKKVINGTVPKSNGHSIRCIRD